MSKWTDDYISGLKLCTDQRKAAIRGLVDQLMPLRTRWWQWWRYTDERRYRLAFALVNFLLECRR